MQYTIRTRKDMRYPTSGDYYFVGDNCFVDVKEQINPDYELLIAIHELIEEYLTRKNNINEPDILKFDLEFEEERKQGLHTQEDEPGHDIRAPYHKQHVFAENIERLIAQELNINWIQYGKDIQ